LDSFCTADDKQGPLKGTWAIYRTEYYEDLRLGYLSVCATTLAILC